jgi:hypothetical protein
MLTNGLGKRWGRHHSSNGDELQSLLANGRKGATSMLSSNNHLWASFGK